MKKIAVALFLVSLFSGCEDAKVEVQSFDFSDGEATVCGQDEAFFLYKVKTNEALIVKFNESELKNSVSTENDTLDLNITETGTNRVLYRLYDGAVSAGTICTTIPPSSPVVTNEWTATSGLIRIVTSAVYQVDAGSNAKLPDGFLHTISFVNITFDTGDGEVTYDKLDFGTKKIDFNIEDFSCADNCDINRCDNTTRLFLYKNLQALTFDPNQATFNELFANAATSADSPRTQNIADLNLTFRVFETGLLTSNFCENPEPASMVATEIWTAVSGTLSVSTTTLGNAFQHTLTLENVTFQRTDGTVLLDFTFGDAYILGQLVTTP